ncbi:hypothetical protein HOLleu_15327 [Holothuria leucospilota]|uniref:Uncharacterized protein n=1 Tax=Holothuria leucospilota TaxID=206669 RepID=A0A9Q1HCD7_HOLLE|nr:hypothetical protein HOLleu_15327 [Holothuria leucospilota]
MVALRLDNLDKPDPRRVAKPATLELVDIIDQFESSAPDAFTIINGDFNHCDLRKSSVHYYQQVKCATCDTATLDLLYTNVKDAYLSIQLPKLERSQSKPWITKKVKTVINKKKGLFKKGDSSALREVQKELKRVIAQEKAAYRDKIESLFTDNNMRRVWDGIRLMSGYRNNSNACHISEITLDYANDLNHFYNRFDQQDFSHEYSKLQNVLTDPSSNIVVSEEDVRRQFSRLNLSKAAGPDNVPPKVLKHCAIELAHIFTVIYNMSFKTVEVPQLWKQSSIIPVPKRSVVSCYE